MSKKKKVLTLVLALALLLTCAIGGTVAWLIDETKDVTNTFTIGNINIKLEEEGAIDGEQGKTKTYSNVVPGDKKAKDAKVTVEKGS